MSAKIEQLVALLAEHCGDMDTAHVGAKGFDGITFRYNPPKFHPADADIAVRWTVFTCFGKSDGPTLEEAIERHIAAIPDVLEAHVERVQANHAKGCQLRERLHAMKSTGRNERG